MLHYVNYHIIYHINVMLDGPKLNASEIDAMRSELPNCEQSSKDLIQFIFKNTLELLLKKNN